MLVFGAKQGNNIFSETKIVPNIFSLLFFLLHNPLPLIIFGANLRLAATNQSKHIRGNNPRSNKWLRAFRASTGKFALSPSFDNNRGGHW